MVPTHLGTKAVADSGQLLDLERRLQVLDDGLADGVDLDRRMPLLPRRKVKRGVLESRNGQIVAVKEVGNDGEKSARGKGVGNQLDVLVDAKDVCKDEDCRVRRRVVGRTRKVRVDWDGKSKVSLLSRKAGKIE